MSSVVCDSTHDSLVFTASMLGAVLQDQGLPHGYWIADAAYICSESLLKPFSSIQLLNEDLGLCAEAVIDLGMISSDIWASGVGEG